MKVKGRKRWSTKKKSSVNPKTQTNGSHESKESHPQDVELEIVPVKRRRLNRRGGGDEAPPTTTPKWIGRNGKVFGPRDSYANLGFDKIKLEEDYIPLQAEVKVEPSDHATICVETIPESGQPDVVLNHQKVEVESEGELQSGESFDAHTSGTQFQDSETDAAIDAGQRSLSDVANPSTSNFSPQEQSGLLKVLQSAVAGIHLIAKKLDDFSKNRASVVAAARNNTEQPGNPTPATAIPVPSKSLHFCSTCGISFVRKDTLKRHENTSLTHRAKEIEKARDQSESANTDQRAGR